MNLTEIADYEPPVMCFSCRYFVVDRKRRQKVAPSPHFSGECRRFPPSLANGEAEDQGPAAAHALKRGWPVVSEIDWCGEAERRLPD